MSKDHRFYDLNVRDSELFAEDKEKVVLRGNALTGATLWLRRNDGAQFGLRISDVQHTVHEVVDPGLLLYTYKFAWSRVVSSQLPGNVDDGVLNDGNVPVEPVLDPKNLPMCPVWNGEIKLSGWTTLPGGSADRNGWPSDTAWDESTAIPPFNAIVFEGDRFDATKRTVSPTWDDRWFNIGCARHTLAKMRLSRNTLHTTANNDWRPVQATLKMLSADYCGDGTAFTVAGTPLIWQQSPPGMKYYQPPRPASLEARWNEHGAICIASPRLEVHHATKFPNVMRLIMQRCPLRKVPVPSERMSEVPGERRVVVTGLPKCGDTDPRPKGELITTANYTPP